MARRVFMLAGELSGDRLGAWYIAKERARRAALGDHEEVVYVGIGGDAMVAAGVTLWETIRAFSIVGVVEVIKHLPRLFALRKKILAHIREGAYDEVVVIDFPGFNLWFLGALKTAGSFCKVTYLSPPHLWVWGSWRLKKLVARTDRIIVIYPYEVAWYAARGVTVEFWGTPTLDRMAALPVFADYAEGNRPIERSFWLFPGSRMQELEKLMPLYGRIAAACFARVPFELLYVSCADTIDPEKLYQLMSAVPDFFPFLSLLRIVSSSGAVRAQSETMRRHAIPSSMQERGVSSLLAAVCRAPVVITKPGTNTLELAILGVPAIVVYQAPWITYYLARLVVNVTSMTLPNLIMGETVMPEFIQAESHVTAIAGEWARYVEMAECDRKQYEVECARLRAVRKKLAPQE